MKDYKNVKEIEWYKQMKFIKSVKIEGVENIVWATNIAKNNVCPQK